MIYAVMGPTASSKSSYSVNLAKKVNAEIINVDAYSIYKDIDIISAKISKEEMNGVKHHFVSHYDINDNVDVKRFQSDVRECISNIIDQNKNVILVGGSNLYMFAILFEYEFKTVDYDYLKYENWSDEDITNKLRDIDEDYVELSQQNRRRQIKAILYFEKFNEKFSKKEQKSDTLFYSDVKFIYLNWQRDELYKRINQRVDIMFDQGIRDEFNYLSEKYSLDANAFKAIGAKEFIDYKDDEIIKSMIKQNSRRLAKRQISWINNKLLKNNNLDIEIINLK